MTTLHIKNMVCPRCVMAVEQLLHSQQLHAQSVTLGEAIVEENLSDIQIDTLRSELKNLGFELLDNPQLAIVEKIRTLVLEWVHLQGERPRLSSYIQELTHKDYSQLSKLFSSVRGMTIERYCILQRVELIKELLCYSEKTTSEIAYELGYSSPAHLSAQFKQVTGMSPKAFKQTHSLSPSAHRRFLDEI